MCQYLFAAFSLKQTVGEGLSATELAAVQRWRKQVAHVAAQEMLHLALVQNLLSAIGAAPHRQKRCLIDEVRQIRSHHSGSASGDDLQIDVFGHADLAGVHFQNLNAVLEVGPVDQHLAIEAAGAQ